MNSQIEAHTMYGKSDQLFEKTIYVLYIQNDFKR